MAQVVEILPQDKKTCLFYKVSMTDADDEGSLHRQGISNHDAAYAEL